MKLRNTQLTYSISHSSLSLYSTFFFVIILLLFSQFLNPYGLSYLYRKAYLFMLTLSYNTVYFELFFDTIFDRQLNNIEKRIFATMQLLQRIGLTKNSIDTRHSTMKKFFFVSGYSTTVWNLEYCRLEKNSISTRKEKSLLATLQLHYDFEIINRHPVNSFTFLLYVHNFCWL